MSVGGERYDLLSQGAQDLGRYGILKDVSRLERAAALSPGATGVALALANDSAYWKPVPVGGLLWEEGTL